MKRMFRIPKLPVRQTKIFLMAAGLTIGAGDLYSQNDPYTFGATKYSELGVSPYEKDTSAAAVILQEYGHSTIESNNNNNLLFTYYVRIRILKKSGLDKANVSVRLQKADGKYDLLRSVRASSFTIENSRMIETKLAPKNVFTENYNKYWDVKKFAVPNVRVGSIIEYEFQVETPFFVSNFRPWEFQADIPKLSSEYWATIPANYKYNIALTGVLKLQKKESVVLDDYFTPGGQKADCIRYKWAMNNIPAFVEEEYMTARKNFVSAISFELQEIQYFDGRKDKVTKEWKDAEQELRKRDDFGAQLRRGKDVVDKHIEEVVAGEPDELEKAKKVFEFLRGWYRWNEFTGKYSEYGIRKAFEKKEGNVGDINLSLIAALRYAGLNVEPVILATRDKGLPRELFPVLTDFNYVVAKVNIGDKSFLLDATDDFVPFGVLPERCLNGKGRVLGDTESYWLELKANERAKQISIVTLSLNDDGSLKGEIKTTYMGYRAAAMRRKIYSFTSHALYIKDQSDQWNDIDITSYEFENLDNISKNLGETLQVELDPLDLTQSLATFNPMILERWHSNPFKSSQRLFPVDFGVPFEEMIVVTIEFPPSFEVSGAPPRAAFALPNGGGRYLYELEVKAGKIVLNSSLLIAKPIFGSNEYFHLKEFFSRVVSSQATELVLRKRAAGD